MSEYKIETENLDHIPDEIRQSIITSICKDPSFTDTGDTWSAIWITSSGYYRYRKEKPGTVTLKKLSSQEEFSIRSQLHRLSEFKMPADGTVYVNYMLERDIYKGYHE